METVVSFGAFVGAWLLFAGPIYQAALELREHEMASDRIRSVRTSVPPPPRISRWWWLVPPVWLILNHRRQAVFQQAYMAALTTEDFAALVAFMEKAKGWLFVAGGALLLAAKETYGLSHELHLSRWIFFVVAPAMAAVSVVGTIVQIARSEDMLSKKAKIDHRPIT